MSTTLTATEAAERLGVSNRYLRRRLLAGDSFRKAGYEVEGAKVKGRWAVRLVADPDPEGKGETVKIPLQDSSPQVREKNRQLPAVEPEEGERPDDSHPGTIEAGFSDMPGQQVRLDEPDFVDTTTGGEEAVAVVDAHRASEHPDWNRTADGQRYGQPEIRGYAPGRLPFQWGAQPVDRWPVHAPRLFCERSAIKLSCWMKHHPPYVDGFVGDGVALESVWLSLEFDGGAFRTLIRDAFQLASARVLPDTGGEREMASGHSDPGEAFGYIMADHSGMLGLRTLGAFRARCLAMPIFRTVVGGKGVNGSYGGATVRSPWYDVVAHDDVADGAPGSRWFSCVREDGKLAHWTPGPLAPSPLPEHYRGGPPGLYLRWRREALGLDAGELAALLHASFPWRVQSEMWWWRLEAGYVWPWPTGALTDEIARILEVDRVRLQNLFNRGW